MALFPQDPVEMIPSPGQKINFFGLNLSAAAFVLAKILKRQAASYLVYLPTPIEAEDFIRDLEFFWPEGAANEAVLLLPSYDVKPFSGQSPAPELVFDRLRALYALITGQNPLVVVTSAPAALQLSLPGAVLSKNVDFLQAGQEIDRDEFLVNLVNTGYFSGPLVQGPGDFSVRGGILDLYPPGMKRPVRAEFFGDYIESLRTFRTLDQRTVGEIEELAVLPANEVILDSNRGEKALAAFRTIANREGWQGAICAPIEEKISQAEHFSGLESFLPLFYDRLYSPDEYADSKTIRLIFDQNRFTQTGAEHLERLQAHLDRLREAKQPTLSLDRLYQAPDDFTASLEGKPLIKAEELALQDKSDKSRSFHFRLETNEDLKTLINRPDKTTGLLAPFVARVRAWLDQDLEVILACHTKEQAKRIAKLLEDYSLYPALDLGDRKSAAKLPARFQIKIGFLSSGFVLNAFKCAFVSEEELFGPRRRVVRRAIEEIKGVHLSSFQDLSVGDFIVHDDHGIGQYQGLVKLDVGDLSNDYLHLVYRGGDRLYVPVDRFGAVQKYIGSDGKTTRLDKLGSETWDRVKKKIKASILEMAEDLIRLYAERETQKGHAFSPTDGYYREFEASFEFEETPDQLTAIKEIVADMESEKPMDRLVCGDVGFGKTEVAMRAVFRAVLDGKQVAVLVPTTVLAEQHYQTFSERFSNYPVKVDVLSRFKGRKEQREVLARLASGKLDVIVGTHRLMQKDIVFKDLGLLIIDEEHRFGVKQKERLKKLKLIVDVLALSATPIPRTLQMSLTNIRNLSIIETPPQDRQAIKTYLLKYDEITISEAIAQELDRGGQVFFVHNRVKDIDVLTSRLRELMPLVRFGVAHGQQKERDLERVMVKFLHREIDVLVTTTIIESGLDIPTANTIIINNADRFGLSQIYQLRGRVGRSGLQAYAYLLVSNEDALSRIARKRLKALMDFSELGSGFKIALHDLQLRGAGNLLGVAQSGHIAAVGYEMYVQLMEQTIREIKGEKTAEKIDPEMVLDLEAYIPETYVPDTEQRLIHYRRFSSLKDADELADLCDELIDRYGPMPPEVKQLVKVIELKHQLMTVGVKKLEMGQGGLTLSFIENGPIDPDKILELIGAYPDQARLYPDGRLFLAFEGLSGLNGLKKARNILQEIT
ncbi:MAG: transcription-repair coupling factor [Deltaproteobacteria bacterium]|nr:transcription-repair coupling factor [Deltaproteobacteria bacterium]